MKTLARILIILAIFALVMGITYAVVNAGSSNPANVPMFTEGNGGSPPLPNGERPEFRDGERSERGERGGGWIFGAVKNIGVVSIIVVLIVLPKGWMSRRKRDSQMANG